MAQRMELETALLSGVPVGIGQSALCDVCGHEMHPNDNVEIIVLLEGTTIDLVTTRCKSCARGELHRDTRRSCWLATGTLAGSIDSAGHSRIILAGARVKDRTE